MTFHPLDICIIQNCVKPQCIHLNGTNCIFLRKEGNNYIVICPNEPVMRSLAIKNNNIKLDKDKNIEFIPGGNFRKVETRTNNIALNIKERIFVELYLSSSINLFFSNFKIILSIISMSFFFSKFVTFNLKIFLLSTLTKLFFEESYLLK